MGFSYVYDMVSNEVILKFDILRKASSSKHLGMRVQQVPSKFVITSLTKMRQILRI
jgi:hypothetical protein